MQKWNGQENGRRWHGKWGELISQDFRTNEKEFAYKKLAFILDKFRLLDPTHIVNAKFCIWPQKRKGKGLLFSEAFKAAHIVIIMMRLYSNAAYI